MTPEMRKAVAKAALRLLNQREHGSKTPAKLENDRLGDEHRTTVQDRQQSELRSSAVDAGPDPQRTGQQAKPGSSAPTADQPHKPHPVQLTAETLNGLWDRAADVVNQRLQANGEPKLRKSDLSDELSPTITAHTTRDPTLGEWIWRVEATEFNPVSLEIRPRKKAP